MASEQDLSFQQRSLFQQGYQSYTPKQLKQLEWGLRFTPAVCSLIALYGLITQQPIVLFAVAALGLLAFFLPARHPMDMLYNHGVRHIFSAVALPPNPFQRRLACFSAGLMNIAAGSLFLLNLPVAAYVVGGMLLILQAIVIFTHFCTLSWMYEGVMRALGKWIVPLSGEKAKSLLNDGAVLIDVRSQNEFARGHVEGAINIPLENIGESLHQIPQGTKALYCNSGTRSHVAVELLKQNDVSDAFNIGGIEAVKKLVAA